MTAETFWRPRARTACRFWPGAVIVCLPAPLELLKSGPTEYMEGGPDINCHVRPGVAVKSGLPQPPETVRLNVSTARVPGPGTPTVLAPTIEEASATAMVVPRSTSAAARRPAVNPTPRIPQD
jgi:hypothetical protein